MFHARWRVGIFSINTKSFVRANDIDSFTPHLERNLRLDARARTARWTHFRPCHEDIGRPWLCTFIDVRHGAWTSPAGEPTPAKSSELQARTDSRPVHHNTDLFQHHESLLRG
jgi:hypothetical protein